ncbi:MAG: metallophosphoesterase family protein [Saprospiraceae bacterium]|nr:metallophosphoesterase family protein [Saprospiraceae bacterium]
MKIVLTCCLLMTSLWVSSQEIHKEYTATKFPDRVILGWNGGDVSKSQSVNWRTDSSVTVAIAEIALSTGSPDFTKNATKVNASTEALIVNGQTVHYHQVHFTELKPNTMYDYRVGDGTYWSEWFQFTTASDKADPFSFLYFGDAQNDLRSMWSRTIRNAYSKMPEISFMVHAGDLINNANYDFQWGEWFEAGGWLNGMVPSLASPGNHEYARNTTTKNIELSEHWKPSFVHPQNGPQGLEETVYSVVHQGVLFVSLDSQAAMLDSSKMESQAQWLEKLLTSNKNKWVVVFHHHPVYSTKAGRNNEEWRNVMEAIYKKYKVDIVLQGHDHTYGRGINMPLGSSRKHPYGPIYVVSVSGPKMYDIGLQDWMDRAASNVQLYQLISIDNNNLSYKAYEATGTLYDAFDLIKDNAGKNELVDRSADLPKEQLDLPPAVKEKFTEEQMKEYESRIEAYKKRKGLK